MNNDDFQKLTDGFAKALGGRSPELEAYVESGNAHIPEGAELLIWDVNSVHDYVFDTGNAAVIRGASEDLKKLDRSIKDGEVLDPTTCHVIYAGGGGGVAVVMAESRDAASRALHRCYAERTLVATCTVASAPLLAEPFGRQIQRLRGVLAQKRTRIGPDAEASIPTLARRCRICGRRAAALAPERTRGPRDECLPCYNRLERGKRGKDPDEADGFESIAGPSRKLGVVYLDGNGIGDTFAQLRSPWAYRQFSQALDQLTEKILGKIKGDYRLDESRYQNPIAGGDDIVLIVPGDRALPLARDLLKAFVRDAAKNEVLRTCAPDRTVGAAVGVALGKMKLPIRHLINEAEDLLKKGAKKRIYSSERPSTALDFNVVDDGSTRRSFAKAPRFEKRPDGSLAFSAKPYTLEEFQTFTERREVLLKLATSQRHALRQVGELGPNQTRNHVLYQIGRHETWQAVARELAGDGSADPTVDPDVAMACFIHDYGSPNDKLFTLDVGDVLEVEGYWGREFP